MAYNPYAYQFGAAPNPGPTSIPTIPPQGGGLPGPVRPSMPVPQQQPPRQQISTGQQRQNDRFYAAQQGAGNLPVVADPRIQPQTQKPYSSEEAFQALINQGRPQADPDGYGALFNWLSDFGAGAMASGDGDTGMVGIGKGFEGARQGQLGRIKEQRGKLIENMQMDLALQKMKADRRSAEAAYKKAEGSWATPLIKNLMVQGLIPGTKEFTDAMSNQLAGKDNEFRKLMVDSGIDPDSIKGQKLMSDRMNKLTNISQTDPVVEAIKAMNKGVSEESKQYGGARGTSYAEMVDRGDIAGGAVSGLDTLEDSLVESAARGVTSGGFTGAINSLKVYAESIGSAFGMGLPDGWESDPNFQFSDALQKTFVRNMLKSKMGTKPTDKDLQFLIDTLPNMGLTPENNALLIENMREGLMGDLDSSLDYLDHQSKQADAYQDTYARTSQTKARQRVLDKLAERITTGKYTPGVKMGKRLFAREDVSASLDEQLQAMMAGGTPDPKMVKLLKAYAKFKSGK